MKKRAIFLSCNFLNTTKRKLGILEGKAKVIFKADFKITEDQFLNIKTS
jgi:hypothetical protein